MARLIYARIAVLVPGYGGRVHAIERWRMAVAVSTLAAHGGGRLVVSGHRGEAGRLAALAPAGADVAIEPNARSTQENVERSIPLLLDADLIAIATDRCHRRRAASYLRALSPELATRVVEPEYSWRRGWWMDAAGVAYALSLRVRRRPRNGEQADLS